MKNIVMTHFKLIVSFFFAIIGFVPGYAQLSRHVVKVGDFVHLNVIDNLHVEYYSSVDSAGCVVFRSSSDMAKQLLFSNDGKGKLSVQATYDALQNQSQLPVLRIYSTALNEVTNDGVQEVRINTLAATPVFKATLSDNGTIVVNGLNTATTGLKITTGKGRIIASGQTAQLKCGNLGTGTVNAVQLKAREINCSLIGTGTIYCHSTGGKLSVKGTGTGKVLYKGTPLEIKVKKIGPLKVLPYQE